MKFTRYAPDHYTLSLTLCGWHSLVKAFTHRRRKRVLICEKCGGEIADGAKAYREDGPAKDRQFINGVAWCAACVEGSS